MTRDEYTFAFILAEENGVQIPPFKDLQRGGIVGQAEITDCVRDDASPWFFGEFGFVLTKALPLPFQPCKGALKIFTPAL